ncbi:MULTISPECIES: hypothetical protein [unclassified Microcoleus]|uniref:hypothetical protein n=1 Tax=unclassified Microcoleus TaxID=2642155 RepID=UPI002FD0AF5C
MPETTPNYSPAILGTSIAVLWFIHTGLSSSKEYNNYLSKLSDFFNKKPIILPSLIVLISPFILTRLALPEYELTGAFKQFLSIFTFVLGVVIARGKEKSDSRKRDKILANSLLVESFDNLERLNRNKTRIQEKVDSPLLPLKLTKVESIVNVIAETQEVNSIKLVTLHLNIKSYIKPLKRLNSRIRKYNEQLDKKLANSSEDSQQLLPQILEIREKILKIIKVLSSF